MPVLVSRSTHRGPRQRAGSCIVREILLSNPMFGKPQFGRFTVILPTIKPVDRHQDWPQAESDENVVFYGSLTNPLVPFLPYLLRRFLGPEWSRRTDLSKRIPGLAGSLRPLSDTRAAFRMARFVDCKLLWRPCHFEWPRDEHAENSIP